MVKQKKDFRTMKRKAKTFRSLVAVIRADHHNRIDNLRRLLKERHRAAIAARPEREKSIREKEAMLKSLEARFQRYEKYHSNRKLPAALRKGIGEVAMELLRHEPGYDSWERELVRCRRKELAELFERADRLLNPPKAMNTTNKKFKGGGDYSRQAITRTYDGHVWEVLKWHFEPSPSVKGQKASIRIVAALPEKDEYLQLKETHFTRTVDALVDEASGIISQLQSEMQEAYENTPDGLQQGLVGEARYEAAQQLDDIASDSPTVPPSISSVRLVHYPSTHLSSRARRAGEAAAMLRAALVAIQQFLSDGTCLKKGEARDVAEFCGQVEDHIVKIEEVDFPGMFG